MTSPLVSENERHLFLDFVDPEVEQSNKGRSRNILTKLNNTSMRRSKHVPLILQVLIPFQDPIRGSLCGSEFVCMQLPLL
jgi:hypothetical protein